ncbi:hypothetical protein SK128_026267 [Halocaridina rubra]|uniref:Uncharacterized protein n=1 Tax=Halocaridina rubra TaxID=373956 RepID=A0AAN8X6W9_HALRR
MGCRPVVRPATMTFPAWVAACEGWLRYRDFNVNIWKSTEFKSIHSFAPKEIVSSRSCFLAGVTSLLNRT